MAEGLTQALRQCQDLDKAQGHKERAGYRAGWLFDRGCCGVAEAEPGAAVDTRPFLQSCCLRVFVI
jgi:hypothetical protein